MQVALDAILKSLITRGRLSVRWPDGRTQNLCGAAPDRKRRRYCATGAQSGG